MVERAPAIGVLQGICEVGVRKVSRLYESLKTRYVPVEDLAQLDPDLESFTNVNDLDKLTEITSRVGTQ